MDHADADRAGAVVVRGPQGGVQQRGTDSARALFLEHRERLDLCRAGADVPRLGRVGDRQHQVADHPAVALGEEEPAAAVVKPGFVACAAAVPRVGERSHRRNSGQVRVVELEGLP